MINAMLKILRKTRASLLKRWFQKINAGYSVGHAYGARFLFDWNHSLDKKVAVELYERAQIHHLCQQLDDIQAEIFIDAGAHAALYSLILKRRYPALEVHAFEPDRTNLCQLYANLFVNQLTKQIHVHEYGLSDRNGRVAFETSDEASSRGTRRISQSAEDHIEIRRLDDVITVRDKMIAIKIDVEGHEFAVLEGAKALLSGNRCLLQIESAPDKFAALQSQMSTLGYRWLSTLNDHFFTNIDAI